MSGTPGRSAYHCRWDFPYRDRRATERFESLATPGKFVSISYWRDEAAVAAWRGHTGHMAAQALGKSEIFADYRITVAEALRDYGSEGAAPD